MKLCPKCNAELDDNTRFCLHCMTSLDKKEQIPPPARKLRWWPLVLLGLLVLCIAVLLVCLLNGPEETDAPETTENPVQTEASVDTNMPETSLPDALDDPTIRTCTVDGVCYTFRPAVKEDHPTAIIIDNHYVLIRVEGEPNSGIYQVPSFVGEDTNALVTVVADGAFSGTEARKIDLGYNVRYVWGDAFAGCGLTDLYLHEDVRITQTTLSGCTKDLTIHCPEYLENTEGSLWSELAVTFGFRWQSKIF